jgi:hypothetical protein
MWHCPHCGAPQAETARCWVCRRSSTTCSTCRNFRVSLAPDLGFCALDRKRRPLTGRELRGCWAERPSVGEAQAATGAAVARDPLGPRRPTTSARGFIPLDEVEPISPSEPFVPAPILLIGEPVEPWEARTSLFGDLDR